MHDDSTKIWGKGQNYIIVILGADGGIDKKDDMNSSISFRIVDMNSRHKRKHMKTYQIDVYLTFYNIVDPDLNMHKKHGDNI